MCPACISTLALYAAAGVSSTGGLAAIVARTLKRMRAQEPSCTETKPELRDGVIAARQIPEGECK